MQDRSCRQQFQLCQVSIMRMWCPSLTRAYGSVLLRTHTQEWSTLVQLNELVLSGNQLTGRLIWLLEVGVRAAEGKGGCYYVPSANTPS